MRLVLAQVLDLLQRDKCLSYRVLKRRLGMDDDEMEDLKRRPHLCQEAGGG